MKATIIGGGITGLTVAAFLTKYGLDFELFEATDTFKPVGTGIIMSPNALFVFNQLGLDEKITSAGFPLPRFDITDARGNLIQKNSTEYELHGRTYHAHGIHRSVLHEILLSAIPARQLQLGHRLSHLELSTRQITFTTGNSVGFDYLLGCDGIHSPTRQAIFPATTLRYSGQTCWRGIAEVDLAATGAGNPAEMWGQGIRFGFVPLAEKKVYWYATAVAPAGGHDRSLRETRDYLCSLFTSFAPFVKKLIEPSQFIVRHDLSDIKPLQRWSVADILLLGDAAHAMTPNLGQGAAQGIEDAWVISNFLRSLRLPHLAFAAYTEARFRKVKRVSNLSWQIGQLTNLRHRLLCSTRDIAFRYAPQGAARRQRQRIFAVPTAAELAGSTAAI